MTIYNRHLPSLNKSFTRNLGKGTPKVFPFPHIASMRLFFDSDGGHMHDMRTPTPTSGVVINPAVQESWWRDGSKLFCNDVISGEHRTPDYLMPLTKLRIR